MQWSKVPDAGAVPGARSSHALAAIDDTLYLFGGELVARTPLPGDLYAYDTKRRCWRRCELSGRVMGPRLGHSMTAVGRDLFTFGGRTGVQFADSTLGDMFKIDADSMECIEVHAAGTAPQPRSYHAATSSSDHLYIFGGCGAEGRLNDLHCYNVQTNRWQALPASPDIKPRGGAGLVAHADKLFVIGGFSGKEQGDVHMFDLTHNTWQEVTGGMPLPARSVFACGLIPQTQNKEDYWIVVFGGEVDPSDLGHEGAGAYADEAFVLDPKRPQLGWHQLQVEGSAPPPRAWLASTFYGSGVALHGGNAPDNSRLDDLFFLQR